MAKLIKRQMTQQEIDKALRLTGPVARFASLTAAGLNWSEFTLSPAEQKEASDWIRIYSEKFTRLMLSKFKQPVWNRADLGSLVNVDEAIEGVSDCYRSIQNKKRAPLRVMINVSRDWASAELTGMRGGAIMALIGLCARRGQAVKIEIAYGNGLNTYAKTCHVRIGVPSPNIGTLTRLCCSSDAISIVGRKVREVGGTWVGGYRFWEFQKDSRFPEEFDFVLDRIDTNDRAIEEARILDQLKAFSLL